jgi:hypothetical protein
MEEIKAPKKERKFLKAVGNIAKVLANELVMGIGRKFIGKAIDKVGNKKQGLSIVLIILASTFAFAQYPATGNKQRLGFQTTGDGLTWRGSISDTASIQPINNTSAWVILDTVNLKFYSFDFTSNVWNSVGGAAFEQPVDSLFFNTGVPTNNVETAKMRWDSDLATVVLGLNDNVPNELGFKNFWLVKNQTGSTITKGSIVYANGTVGASGRITIDKFIADGSIDAKYLLGITAHDLSNGEDGYVISFGKIRKVNTDTFAAGAILYPSPTVAGVWTDIEPIAPNIDMPIGFCINSHANNGTIAIRVASGYKLSELHDVAISSPVEKASLYYSGGLWRDTTATILVSDTASMLTNYLRTGVAASTYLPLTGGTLSGSLDINTNNGSNSFQDSTLKVTYNQSSLGVNQNVTGIYSSVNTTGYTSTGILSEASTIYTTAIGVKGKATQSDINGPGVAIGIVGEIAASGSGSNGSTYAGYFNNTSTVGGNHYGLFVNTASGGDYGIYQTGSGINYLGSNTNIGGTLGVTGETTLSAPLTVNSSAVFNEGSAIADFRVESDGNINMLFVDGTNNRVGIGTNAPTKTLEVNGELKISTVTATPTSLLGKDDSNVVGELELGTGMSIGSGILSVQAAGASATGLVTSFGSQTFGGNKTFNGTVTLKSATGTADTVIGRNSTGQIVNLTLGSGLSLSGGTLSASDNANSSLFISRTGTTVEFVEDLTIYSVIYLKLNNNSTITVTLPTASLTTNKSITIKNIGSGAVNSNASNVEPLNSSSLSSVILTSGGGKFTTLVSDGTNWIKMTGN